MQTKRRRQLRLPAAALMMSSIILSAAIPAWIGHSGGKAKASYWQMAVYRFDTGVLFSCEAFAREIAGVPLSDFGTQQEGQWERIPPNRLPARASTDCLMQAGLMVV